MSHLATASSAGGSFWQGHLDKGQRPLSNHMALMATGCQAVNSLRSGCAAWTSETIRTAGPLVLGTDEFLLLSTGGGLNQWEPQPFGLAQWVAQRRTTTGWHAVGLGDALDNPLFGNDLIPLLLEFTDTDETNRSSQPVFLFLVPENYTVLTVVGAHRLLHAGIHFESRPGAMIFRDHPERWLPYGPSVVKLALDTGPLTSDYVLSADVRGAPDVSNFYRQLTTPGTLLAASCAAAGLVQVKENGVVAAVIEKPGNGVVYVLEHGSHIDVPYDHAVLAPGTILTIGSYIGASPLLCNGVSRVGVEAYDQAVYEINSRIAGLTPSATTSDIYSYANHTTGVYVRNPGCWAAGIDLTPIAAANDGGWGFYSGSIGYVLLSPTKVLTTVHQGSATGVNVRWVTAGNETVTRQVTGAGTLVQRTGHAADDLKVYTLSAPIYNITPVSWLDTDFDPINLPLFAENQFGKALVTEVLSHGASYIWLKTAAAMSPQWEPWTDTIISGDSAHTMCAVLGGKLALCGVYQWGYGNPGGANCALPEIRDAVMAAAGEDLPMISGDSAQESVTWWVAAPWGAGVDLSEHTPWALFAPNSPVDVDCTDSTAGRAHAQIALRGSDADLQRWWAACKANEIASGIYLSEILGLGVGDVAKLNPLWIFAQYAWTTTALVVDLNATGLEDKMRERMFSFLKRERPLGKILLVLDHQQQ